LGPYVDFQVRVISAPPPISSDLTHLVISLIERRLKDAFPGISFDVHGTPKDLDSALDPAKRNKYQF
jgi:site-specific DNA-methyltransferase (adenine-specific)